jgi:glutathione S-transferase
LGEGRQTGALEARQGQFVRPKLEVWYIRGLRSIRKPRLTPIDGALDMKLYVTYRSPYARLARIIVIEKALEDRVEIIAAKTRTADSPYYQINPSGRVPYLVDETGTGMEDSQLICAYLDGLDGKPRFHDPSRASDWACRRLEFAARSMCDGIAVWGREMARPENERSPTTLSHESARAQRMADFFENRVTDPPLQEPPGMAHFMLAVAIEMARKRGLGDLAAVRPRLATWMRSISDLPSMQRTAPP